MVQPMMPARPAAPGTVMRAVVVRDLIGPAGARLETVPVPAGAHRLSPGRRMLIEVHAAGVAFPDVLMSHGTLQLDVPAPYIAGTEASGVVIEAPEDSGFKPGDRVAGSVLGGAMAEYALMRPEFTIRLPDGMSYAGGAALHLNYVTAWLALEKAGFASGQWVLVLGAAGGLGTAALNLIDLLGGRSIALVSSAEKERVALEMGATHVLRGDGSWLPALRELTGGHGVDVVLDPVGGDGFVDHVRALRSGGRILVIGFAGGSIPSIRVNRLLLRNLSVIGFDFDVWEDIVPGTARRTGDAIAALAAEGRIRPYIGSRFPLEHGADAIRVLEDRRALGKVVVDVGRR